MKQVYVLLILTIIGVPLRGQSDKEKQEFDSISYASAIKKLDYLAAVLDSLDKNYKDFSKIVLSHIDNEDINSIELLSEGYIKRVNRMENEMMFNFYDQDFTSTKLIIYNIVSFNVVRLLPDTYAYLFNDSNLSYTPTKIHLDQRDLLYSKYHLELNLIFEKWKDLRQNFRNVLIENGLRDSFQNDGNKLSIDTEKSYFIDLLIWVVNHRELPR